MDNQRSGEGEFHYNTGEVYNGHWADDKQSMSSSLTCFCSCFIHHSFSSFSSSSSSSSPTSYPGGYGELKYASGDVYRGMWREGLRNGKVRLFVCLCVDTRGLCVSVVDCILLYIMYSNPFLTTPTSGQNHLL